MFGFLRQLFGEKQSNQRETVKRQIAGGVLASGGVTPSEEHFSQLVASVRDYAVLLLDQDGNILTWNVGAERIKGYRAEEIIGQNIRTFYPKESVASGWPTHELKVAAETGRFEDEGWRIRKDRTKFWASVVITALRGDSGEIRGYLKITRDLTDRKQNEEKLRLSEERFRLLVDSVGDYAIYMLDTQGFVATWNSGAERLKQYTSDEIIGSHFSRFYPSEALERGWPDEELKRASLEGRFEDEGWRVRKDGTQFWANVVITALRDQSGSLVGFGKVTRDLTLRREREETALRLEREEAARNAAESAAIEIEKQREELHVTLASIGDAVIKTDSEGQVAMMNPIAESLTGWTIRDAAGRPLTEVFNIVTEGTREPVHNPVERAMRHNRIVGLPNHTILVSRDGREVPIDDSAAPIHNGGGATIGGVLVFRDITERRTAERKLRTSELGRQLALDAANLGTWNIDPATNCLVADERFRMIWQSSTLPIDYEQAFDRIHPEDRQRIRDSVAASTNPENPIPYVEEFRVVHPDGSVLWVLGQGRANFEQVGSKRELTSFDGTVSDITVRKAMENHLRQFAASLSAADHRKNEFLATLAHELRNPLAPMRNGLQLIRMAGNDLPKIEEARSMIDRQLEQMVRLVDDLMDVSRISQGKLQLRKETVDLARVISSAAETSRTLLADMNHELIVRLPVEPVLLNGDFTRLAQVVTNLLNNSAKYSTPGSHIRLTVERVEDGVSISVKDEGVGIPPDQLARIFGLFTQIDQSLSKAQGGLGIGLSLVKRIVEMHGGTIEAYSKGDGTGSEFVVTLRLEKTFSDEVKENVVEAVGVQSSLKVLVVDDNQDSADSLAMMLNILGNEARTAYDGDAALVVANEMHPDAILLDIGLPKLNGHEVCKRIRKQLWAKNCLIIAQTGWGQEEDKIETKKSGFDRHLVKPIDSVALMKLFADR